MVRTIEIVPHDTSWADHRAREINRLKRGLGDLVIEPVGSTAVTGLASKPVIDLLLGLDAASDAQTVLPQLVALGYRQGQSLSDEPGTFFLARADEANSGTFHLHVAPRGGPYWHDMVRFRDALRQNSVLAAEYEALKRRLAAAHPDDIDEYSAGKTAFVAQVLRTAR